MDPVRQRTSQKIMFKKGEQLQQSFVSYMATPAHTSNVARQKQIELGCELLTHPPYSPDLASSDFHLFLSLSNALRVKYINDKLNT